MAEMKTRPNIRVEIQNNINTLEQMEVDDEEEGEIAEVEDTIENSEESPFYLKKSQSTDKPISSLTDYCNIFNPVKLQERAKRFQLKPNEIHNFTDNDLQVLYTSLGITSENQDNVKFNSVHMYGINSMSPEDVLDYFLKYAPNSVEWIDEDCCNVVWLDNVTAARALHYTSKIIKGMPVRNAEPLENADIPLLNKDRQVELQHDDLEEAENCIDIKEISIKIPPGYWRLGTKHPKSQWILLRFTFKTDKKPFKTEVFSRYYKLQGKQTEVGKNSIFDRNKDISHDEKNPWGALAQNWDEDIIFRERERESEKIKVKNPSILGRLGSKRIETETEEEEEVKKTKIPRMRMYADEEEEKMKRKKLLKTINTQLDKIDNDKTDLRNILKSNKQFIEEDKAKDNSDLGPTLKNRRKMVFEVKGDPTRRNVHSRLEKRLTKRRSPDVKRRRQRHSDSDDDDNYTVKPKSKIAVVIKTQKKPTVASAVWSKINRRNSDSKSESSSSNSSSSSTDGELSDEGNANRPGFHQNLREQLRKNRTPLKVEINNDHFKK